MSSSSHAGEALPASIAARASLGEMPSMDARCTPAKHRYDACFNAWFEEYLGLGPASSSAAATAAATAPKAKARSGFFGSLSDSSSGGGGKDDAARATLRQRLEGQCGPLWKEYQACIERAVKEKNLGGLIDEARMHNPFPFPQHRDRSKPDSPPFPFPSESPESR